MSGDIETPILLDDAALDELMKFPDVPLPVDTGFPMTNPILKPMTCYPFEIPSVDFKNADIPDLKTADAESADPASTLTNDAKSPDSKQSPSGNSSGSTDPAAQSFQAFAEQNQRLQHENHRYSILVSQLTAEVTQLRSQSQFQKATICQLQTKMSAQRGDFDRKFDQFLSCANQYDQTKSTEIEALKAQIAMMDGKYKDLSVEYGKLTQKCYPVSKPCDTSRWKMWKWLDVYEWIASLHEPRLKKYDQSLYDNLQRDNATGQWLENIQEDDLYYLGVKNYSDRQVLMHHIKMLLHGLTHEPPPTLKNSVSHSSVHEVGSKGTQSTPSSLDNAPLGDAYNQSPSYSYFSTGNETYCHPDHSYYRQFSVEQLQQIRIRQKNIVYIVGLPVSLCNAKLLKSHKWFGKFGTISRICFNTSPKCVKANSIPTFVTYTTDADALQAIRKMNLYCLSDGTRLKTNFGRTKFCPTFTHGQQCLNEKCKFLHQWAKVDDIITEQEISDFNAIRAGPPSRFSRR